MKCFAGLCDSAVPVRVGENLDRVSADRADPPAYAGKKESGTKTTQQLVKWGTEVDLKRLEEAYFQTRVLTRKQYESILRLLTIFAQHLSTLSNQLMVKAETEESPAMAKARIFIAERHAEEISLTPVAGAVNMSAFYFCKVFKKATGMTVHRLPGSRARIEKIKNLLPQSAQTRERGGL